MDNITSLNQNKNKSTYVGGNMLFDTVIGGVLTAAVTGAWDYVAQRKIFKNPEKIAQLEHDVVEFSATDPKRAKEVGRLLELYKNGKIDLGRLKTHSGLGFVLGFGTFLLANLAAKALGFDKKQTKSL